MAFHERLPFQCRTTWLDTTKSQYSCALLLNEKQWHSSIGVHLYCTVYSNVHIAYGLSAWKPHKRDSNKCNEIFQIKYIAWQFFVGRFISTRSATLTHSIGSNICVVSINLFCFYFVKCWLDWLHCYWYVYRLIFIMRFSFRINNNNNKNIKYSST